MTNNAKRTTSESDSGKVFARKANLTRPFFSIAHRERLFVKVTGPKVDRAMEGFARSQDGTIPLLPCIDLETGEEGDLIVPAVMLGVLDRLKDYVGKCFEVVDGPLDPDKNYRRVQVYEVEDPGK